VAPREYHDDLSKTRLQSDPDDDSIKLGPGDHTFQILIRFEADVNLRDRLGMTALHYAVRSHHPSKVRLLLERGANIYQADDRNITPLRIARDDNMREFLLRTAEGVGESRMGEFGNSTTTLVDPETRNATVANVAMTLPIDQLMATNG